MTRALEKRNLDNVWQNGRLLKNVIARGHPEQNRKYRIDKFLISDQIAKFEYGTNCKAEFEGKSVALKRFSPAAPCNIPWKELDFLRHLKHPRVIALVGAFKEDTSYIVLELSHGGCFALNCMVISFSLVI